MDSLIFCVHVSLKMFELTWGSSGNTASNDPKPATPK